MKLKKRTFIAEKKNIIKGKFLIKQKNLKNNKKVYNDNRC